MSTYLFKVLATNSFILLFCYLPELFLKLSGFLWKLQWQRILYRYLKNQWTKTARLYIPVHDEVWPLNQLHQSGRLLCQEESDHCFRKRTILDTILEDFNWNQRNKQCLRSTWVICKALPKYAVSVKQLICYWIKQILWRSRKKKRNTWLTRKRWKIKWERYLTFVNSSNKKRLTSEQCL